MGSYRDLEIYNLSLHLSLKIHELANASCDETIVHLQMISSTHFKNAPLMSLIQEYETLGRKIFTFMKYVEQHWDSNR